MDNKQKIFLIGYMGSGKTTTGKLLAQKMNLQFVDVDLFIENRYRKSITAIFEEKGEAGFREIERQTLKEIAGFENIVISTGGGLPCFFDNMDVMIAAGTTIYLKTSVKELVKRLHTGKQNRPLIKDKNAAELYEFVDQNLQKREPFYNQAAIIFEMDGHFTKKNIDLNIDNLITCLSETHIHEDNAGTH
ncbi:shikimate kinase [Bacteroidia bacterium]|nr:shikimate kinase [Bacteroidia bacterium]